MHLSDYAPFSPGLCAPPQLPCGHKYCKACMVQLREKRVAQTCPLCRKPLPPGPDKLFDLGYRIYAKTMAVVDPNDEGHAVWGNLFLVNPIGHNFTVFEYALLLLENISVRAFELVARRERCETLPIVPHVGGAHALEEFRIREHWASKVLSVIVVGTFLAEPLENGALNGASARILVQVSNH